MKKSAFTLFELIIVVALIGIIYSIVLSNFNLKKDVKISSLKDIKTILMQYWERGKEIDFILYNECKDSALIVNDEINESFKPKINLREFQSIEAYKVDESGNLKQIDFAPIVIEDKVIKPCFKFSIYKNGANSNYIIKQNEKYLIFFPYFKDVNITEDESEAIKQFNFDQYRGVDIEEAN